MPRKDAAANRFQMIPHMSGMFARTDRKLAFTATNTAEWKAWRGKAVAKLKDLTGYGRMRPAPLDTRITEIFDLGDVSRERVEIQTEPGVWMPLYVTRPNRPGAFIPVVTPHGHCGGGKDAVAGVRDNVEISQAIDDFNYDYGLQLARAGFITFAPDARGMGERREPEVGVMGSSCDKINSRALPLGLTVAGMWAWDLSRLIDYVQTRPDARPGKVGCAGLSGGGLQTLYLSAMDERVSAAVTSGYFYGARESLLQTQCCWCNYVPHLWEFFDMGDMGAMIAPRPLLVETGNIDDLNGASGVSNVRTQVSIARKAYRLLGVQGRIKHVVFDGPHRWHGEETPAWLAKWLA